MGNRSKLFYFTLVLGFFFLITGLTGYFQIVTLKKNMEAILAKEAEIIAGYLLREININLEYIDVAGRSELIITPSFLEIMAYEEAIIEDLIENLIAEEKGLDEIPLSNYMVLDAAGNLLKKKGDIEQGEKVIKALLSGKEKAHLKTTKGSEPYILIGFRVDNKKIIVLSLSKNDMAELKKRYVVKEIVEREIDRLKLAGVRIFDQNGESFYISVPQEGNYYKFMTPLSSRHFPGYRMEIFLSRDNIDQALRKTTFHFILYLLVIMALGGISFYMIFILEKKFEKKIVQLEREMARKERLLSLGMLSSTMAHEIRNPLNSIALSIERLRRDFSPNDARNEEYDKLLNVVGKEVRRINKIVEDFLFLSKPEPASEEIDLRMMIEELFVLLKEKAQLKGVELINALPSQIKIRGKREKLKQAFFNLILNGIEAIEDRGYVKVEAEEGEKRYTISITDNGCGIKKEDTERIFEYHYTTKDRGIGIGLPISYMILKEHGGEIKVESEEGKGTVFRIFLPK